MRLLSLTLMAFFLRCHVCTEARPFYDDVDLNNARFLEALLYEKTETIKAAIALLSQLNLPLLCQSVAADPHAQFATVADLLHFATVVVQAQENITSAEELPELTTPVPTVLPGGRITSALPPSVQEKVTDAIRHNLKTPTIQIKDDPMYKEIEEMSDTKRDEHGRLLSKDITVIKSIDSVGGDGGLESASRLGNHTTDGVIPEDKAHDNAVPVSGEEQDSDVNISKPTEHTSSHTTHRSTAINNNQIVETLKTTIKANVSRKTIPPSNLILDNAIQATLSKDKSKKPVDDRMTPKPQRPMYILSDRSDQLPSSPTPPHPNSATTTPLHWLIRDKWPQIERSSQELRKDHRMISEDLSKEAPLVEKHNNATNENDTADEMKSMENTLQDLNGKTTDNTTIVIITRSESDDPTTLVNATQSTNTTESSDPKTNATTATASNVLQNTTVAISTSTSNPSSKTNQTTSVHNTSTYVKIPTATSGTSPTSRNVSAVEQSTSASTTEKANSTRPTISTEQTNSSSKSSTASSSSSTPTSQNTSSASPTTTSSTTTATQSISTATETSTTSSKPSTLQINTTVAAKTNKPVTMSVHDETEGQPENTTTTITTESTATPITGNSTRSRSSTKTNPMTRITSIPVNVTRILEMTTSATPHAKSHTPQVTTVTTIAMTRPSTKITKLSTNSTTSSKITTNTTLKYATSITSSTTTTTASSSPSTTTTTMGTTTPKITRSIKKGTTEMQGNSIEENELKDPSIFEEKQKPTLKEKIVPVQQSRDSERADMGDYGNEIEKTDSQHVAPGQNTEDDNFGFFTCPTIFGFYPDAINCGQFYICSWSLPYHFDCPVGTVWNTEITVCDWPFNVNCGTRPWFGRSSFEKHFLPRQL